MTLSSGTLASGLANMTPAGDEATAISNLVSAWDSYFAQAQIGAVVANAGSYSAGLTAMQGALSGMSATGAAAAAVQSGITAFWAAIASLATSIWTTAPIVLVPPITPPPGLSGISAALASAFASNTSGSASLAASASAVASALHAANAGATVPGSVPPAAPAPLPIV